MMDRRELFPVLAAAAAAAPASPQEAKPRFFTPEEYETLGLLCDAILPPDSGSPGARQAGVPWFIDTVLFYGDEAARAPWKLGLRVVEEAARSRFGRGVPHCSGDQRDQLMALMARNEDKPSGELERFFAPLKRMAVEAYCYSEAGRREYLGYRGDVAMGEFRGCTHKEHQE